ncbi:MAG: DUF1841 family protein [Legionellales bacterium]
MFYGDSIQDTRQMFFVSWDKYQQKKTLQPLEQEIVAVMLAHPEYHRLLENPGKFQEHSYYPEFGETNPFLHMGLHLAVREQITTNRPAGIKEAYAQLLKKYADPLQVEHLIMDQLAECLWLSQKNNLPPDETLYLNTVAGL